MEQYCANIRGSFGACFLDVTRYSCLALWRPRSGRARKHLATNASTSRRRMEWVAWRAGRYLALADNRELHLLPITLKQVV